MIYCDTSLLVSTLVEEPDSDISIAWLAEHGGSGLVVSDWTNVEVASALAMKQRRDVLDTVARQRVWSAWVDLVETSFTFVRVEPADFTRAPSAVDAGAGLRAGDALHLAVALKRGVALATRDGDLAAAAKASGLNTFHVRREEP